MFQAYGLYSHIRANRLKSVFLLLAFVALLQALIFSFALIVAALSEGGTLDDIFASAWDFMAVAWPLGMIGAAIWFAIAYAAHQSMIGLATGAKPVGHETAPGLHAALEELCISRGIATPKLNIIETPALNAFASGLRPSNYAISVTRGLLDNLNKREIAAVLGHELTHIRNKDTQLLVIATIFAGIFAFVGDLTFRNWDFPHGWSPKRPSSSRSSSDRDNGAAILIAIAIALAIIAISWGVSVLIRFAISRSREYLADAGAVELTKDPDAMISALRKIAGHAAIVDMPSRMHAFFIETPAVSRVSHFFATHPPIEDRIAALVRHAGGYDMGADVQNDRRQA
jgi:heat shock protein HtpX